MKNEFDNWLKKRKMGLRKNKVIGGKLLQ